MSPTQRILLLTVCRNTNQKTMRMQYFKTQCSLSSIFVHKIHILEAQNG